MPSFKFLKIGRVQDTTGLKVIKSSIDYTDYSSCKDFSVSFTGIRDYDGSGVFYFINGQKIECSSQEEFEKRLKLLAFS